VVREHVAKVPDGVRESREKTIISVERDAADLLDRFTNSAFSPSPRRVVFLIEELFLAVMADERMPSP
jgi:hypothetical protein